MLFYLNQANLPEIWDELVINDNLLIPGEKPPMERLLGYKVSYEITKARLIRTPLLSEDEPFLPIRKVILEGVAKILVKYVADLPDQQVHGAHFDVPFSKLLIWPGGPPPDTPLNVDILEEHVQFHMIDNRHISKVILIQVNVSSDLDDSFSGTELCPGPEDTISYHNQITLNGLLEIPNNKPPKENIFDSTHQIAITKLTEIRVKEPPGKKVLIAGNYTAGIEYISQTDTQKVHLAHWDIPFQGLILNDDGSLLELEFDLKDYAAYVCVEHEEYEQVDERTIAYRIVLLIWLQRKGNIGGD